MSKELQKIFEDYNFVGKNKLRQLLKQKGIKETTKNINDFYEKQEINQIYNEPRKTSGHIVSFKYLDRVQMDIIDMTKFKHTNSHFGYVLLLIDVFSRKLWGYALKDRTIESVEKALQTFVKDHSVGMITSDNEGSFVSDKIQSLFDKNKIKHETASVGDHKVLGIIDRVCKTIKVMIYKYMKHTNTTKYITQLGRLIDKYNDIPHAGILNLTPDEATKPENFDLLFNFNLEKSEKNSKHRNAFQIGDKIRIRKKKNTFERAYEPKFSDAKIIVDVGKKRATMKDGETVDLRRLRKVEIDGATHSKPMQRDELEEAIRKHKLENNKLIREIKEDRIDKIDIIPERRQLRERKNVSYKV